MAKKAYKVKFYMPHDMDLISLMLTHEVNLTKAMYCSLKAFSKGEAFAIKIPKLREVSLPKHKVYSRNLKLDMTHDKEMIDIMERIALGYRTNFLKNLLRLYLCHPLTEDFLQSNDDMQEFDKKFDVFTKDLKMADAASITNTSIKKSQPRKKKIENKGNTTAQTKAEVLIETQPVEETLTSTNDQELTDLFASLFI